MPYESPTQSELLLTWRILKVASPACSDRASELHPFPERHGGVAHHQPQYRVVRRPGGELAFGIGEIKQRVGAPRLLLYPLEHRRKARATAPRRPVGKRDTLP